MAATRLLTVAALVAVAAAYPALGQDAVDEQLLACSDIADTAERAACFDEVVNNMRQAGEAPAPAAEAPATEAAPPETDAVSAGSVAPAAVTAGEEAADDLVPGRVVENRREYVSLRRFLTDVMFEPFDVVILYDRGRGIWVPKGGEHFHRFLQAFDMPHERINVNGGAIALGHPLGATGAMIINTALDELERSGGGTALCTLCVGNGMGAATILERV